MKGGALLATKPEAEHDSSYHRPGSARPSSKEGEGEAQRPETARAADRKSMLQKKFTFVDATTKDFEEAINRSTGSSIKKDARLVFWRTILVSPPTDAFLPLQKHSIRFWVAAFNTWAFERSKKRKIAGYDVSGQEIAHIFKLDPHSAMLLLVKMNPNLEKPRGVSQKWLEDSTANFLQVVAVGAVVSRAVNAQHKFRFAFSLFDFEGCDSLNADQFAMAFRTLYCGLCGAFSVPPEGASIPAKGSAAWAAEVFRRIGDSCGFDPNFDENARGGPRIQLEQLGN
jgi:hypothetical protein